MENASDNACLEKWLRKAAGNNSGNVLGGTWEWALGNDLGNDADFSLVEVEDDILFTNHPACVILTLFNILKASFS